MSKPDCRNLGRLLYSFHSTRLNGGPQLVSRVNSHRSQWTLYWQKGAGGQSADYTGQVGFVGWFEDYSRSDVKACLKRLIWLICMWKTWGLHICIIQGFDPLREMDSTHARTNAHTGTRTANKSKGRRGVKGRRALAHDEKTPQKNKKTRKKDNRIHWEFGNITR